MKEPIFIGYVDNGWQEVSYSCNVEPHIELCDGKGDGSENVDFIIQVPKLSDEKHKALMGLKQNIQDTQGKIISIIDMEVSNLVKRFYEENPQYEDKPLEELGLEVVMEEVGGVVSFHILPKERA